MLSVTAHNEGPVDPANRFLKIIPADVIPFRISKWNHLLASKVAFPCVCVLAWASEKTALRNSV